MPLEAMINVWLVLSAAKQKTDGSIDISGTYTEHCILNVRPLPCICRSCILNSVAVYYHVIWTLCLSINGICVRVAPVRKRVGKTEHPPPAASYGSKPNVLVSK